MNSALIKAAITALTSKDVQKVLRNVLLVILTPFLLILLVFTSSGDAASSHNQEVIRILFENEPIPQDLPDEFKVFMETMQENFAVLDEEIVLIQEQVSEGVLDSIQIKSFYLSVSLNNPETNQKEKLQDFVLCFLKEKPAADDGNENEDLEEETPAITYAVQLDTEIIRKNIQDEFGLELSDEMMENYRSIVVYVNPGADASTEGEGVPLSQALAEIITESEKNSYIGGTMGSPFEDGWVDKVTSEFGHRSPITLPDGSQTSQTHTGMDFGAAGGTPILAVNDGVVVYVRNHQKGLGLHLVIDHGGGILSVYGHTSRIIVKEGDIVKKGQKIAEVGTTGNSTGNHLHLEIWEKGVPQNARNYLEEK